MPRTGAQRTLPPLVFLKTHKTGSSTMSNILMRLAAGRDLQRLQPNDGPLINWAKLRKSEEPKQKYDLVLNHEIYDEEAVRAYMKPHPFIFGTLREPLAVVDSMFRYRGREGGKYNVSSWAERLEIMEKDRGTWTNPQARDYGWYSNDPRVSFSPRSFEDDNDEAKIAAFLRRLDKGLDLVVLTEHYDEGLVLLRERLNLPLEDVKYLRAKVSEPSPVPPPTAEEEQRARRSLAVDMKLYEHFLQKFREEWRERDLEQEVAKLRKLNEQLRKDCKEPRNSTACPAAFLKENFMHFMP